MTRQTRDRWGAQPDDFNRPVAEAVYKALVSLPDDESAALHGRVLVAACVEHELLSKSGEIRKAFDALAEHRAAALDRGLSRQALAKARRFEDNTPELRALSILHKATFHFSDDERRRYAQQQRRDLRSGRFVRTEHLIEADKNFRGVAPEQEASLGIAPAEHLSGKDRAHYQQAYAQIRELLAPVEGLGEDALAHLHITDAKGKPKAVRIMAVPDRGEAHELGAHLHPGERVRKVTVSVAPPVTAAGATYDALAGLGPTAAQVGYNSVNNGFLSPTRLDRFRNDQSQVHEQDDFIPSARAFRSLENGSKLLSDSLGDAAPRKVRYALAVSEHVGRLGPSAQKVVGPAADKAAYRYRGTERPLPQPLVNSLQLTANSGAGDKRWQLLHGNAKPDGSITPDQWSPSATLNWFRTQLPKADLATLHLKSGAVPPSRGVVFDKEGKTYVEAVGYADDHYLPFNLKGKSLRSLKGGEYIRTRSFGGPTTEDIHTALFSGARGFAVVSNNGVFTVDFAPDLTGGKRFNDSAARMTARYGYLLDAVRSKQVTTGGLDSSRLAELKATAEDVYPEATRPEQHEAEVRRLVGLEQKHPRLSRVQETRAALQFWEDRYPGGRGVGSSRQHMAAAYIDHEASTRHEKALAEVQEARAKYGAAVPPPSLEHYRHQVGNEVAVMSPLELSEKLADETGERPALDAAIRHAEEQNRARLTPLRLNGDGYAKALKALQEEFPHYIVDTQFHPWSTGQGPSDSGYVRPKHNRPAKALAGYFDPHVSRIEGRTKVYADSVRYQNGRMSPRDVETKESTSTTATSSADGKKADPEQVALRQEQADHALFDAIKGAQNVHGEAEGILPAEGGQSLNLANAHGHSLSAVLADPGARKALEAAAPNLLSLHKMERGDYLEAYERDPAAMRAKLARAGTEEKNLKLLGLGKDLLGAQERGGAPAPARKLKERISDSLEHAHADHDFDAPAFSPEAEPDAGLVERTYRADPAIQRLVGKGALPNHPGAGDLKAKGDELVAALKAQRDGLKAKRTQGFVLPPNAYASLDQDSEGVLRALQLGRRHGEATGRDAQRLGREQAAAQPSTTVQNQVVAPPLPMQEEGESDEDYAEKLNRHIRNSRTYMEGLLGGGPSQAGADPRVLDQ